MKTLDELRKGRLVPGDHDDPKEWGQRDPPPWFDEDRFFRGIQFFHDYKFSVVFSYLLSLIAGLNLNMFLQTLIFTGQTSTPTSAGKRYFATLLYIMQWYDRNITSETSLGHKSLMKVRRIHQYARKALREGENKVLLDVVDHETNDNLALVDDHNVVDKAFQEDKDDFVYMDFKDKSELKTVQKLTSKQPMKEISDTLTPDLKILKQPFHLNQYDMAVVQTAFVAGIVLYPTQLGVSTTHEQIDDYLYAWRVFGWYLGIQDTYNICEGDFNDVYSIVGEVRDQELIPAIKQQLPEADMMVRAFIQGFYDKGAQGFNPGMFLSPAALISFSQDPFNMGSQYEPHDLTYYDIFAKQVLKVFFKFIYYFSWFRRFVNSTLNMPNFVRMITG